MDNIIEFHRPLDSVGRTLEAARLEGFTSVVLVGVKSDGQCTSRMFMCSSDIHVLETVGALEMMKAEILA